MQDDGFFGEDVASSYDRDHDATDPAELARTLDVLQDLAGDGPVLEFAVGTGRLALPLIERGCKVNGIELSRAMVAELRRKETGAPMDVAIGDMTSTRLEGAFSLVFLAFNTIDNLDTQEAQVECFRNAARHLAPGGRFLVETLVPPVQKIPYGEILRGFACTPHHIGTDEVDIATQLYTSHHVWISGGTLRRVSIPFRYVWPAELDLMARLAGLDLVHRWGGWDRGPFDRRSTRHVSVWQKPAA